MSEQQQRPQRIGGLWKRETKTGDTWLSISLKRSELERLLEEAQGDYVSLVGFRNQRKERDTHPDFELMQARPKEGTAPRQQRTTASGGATRQPDRPPSRGGHHDAPQRQYDNRREPEHRVETPAPREPASDDIPF